MLSFKPPFSLFYFTFIKRLFSSFSLSAIRVVSSALSKVVDVSPRNLDSSKLDSDLYYLLDHKDRLGLDLKSPLPGCVALGLCGLGPVTNLSELQ